MNKSLISVIVPVYNVEQYLKRCIQTIISQTHQNLEIILVDDGSTDNSGQICEDYLGKDERIKVIHKENGGLSSARNAGMKLAKGDYITFVDSDDFIHPAMYEIMLEVLQKTESDIVVSGICKIEEAEISDLKILQKDELPLNYVSIEKEEILRQIVERDVVTVVQWNKLFKRIIMEGIEYPEGKYHEDVYVIHQELYKCNRVTYLDAELYFYVQRRGSIMHIESWKRIEDSINGYCERISFMKEKGLSEETERAISTLLIHVHWKFKTISLLEGYSTTCKWLGEKFQQFIDIYPEFELKNEDYTLLKSNPYKYCVKLRKEDKRMKRRKYWYQLYK